MEGNKPAARAPKSAHIIDLRQKRGAAATAEPPKPRLGRISRKPKAAAPPKRPARVVQPAATVDEQPVRNESSTPERKPVTARSAAPAPTTSTEFFEAPSERRFWPAFWRFLLLLVILALIISAGVYLYLKFYSS